MTTEITAMNKVCFYIFCVQKFQHLCVVCVKYGHLNNVPLERHWLT